jgi:hypothetical protein
MRAQIHAVEFCHYGNTKKLIGQNFERVTNQQHNFARAFEQLRNW